MDHFSDGLLLRLRLTRPNELAAFYLMPDGLDRCRVGFASREDAAGDGGMMRDGALVCLNRVFSVEHPDWHARRLHHHNRGYAHAEQQSTIILVNHELRKYNIN
jgi:hypothetical protein